GGMILASADGISVTRRDSRTISNLLGIAYAAGVFIAEGSGGTLLTSSDGADWTPRSSGTANDLTAAAFGNGRFVVVGADETILESGPIIEFERFTALSNAAQFTLAGPAGQRAQIQTSTDLVNWVGLTDVTLTGQAATFVILSPTDFRH